MTDVATLVDNTNSELEKAVANGSEENIFLALKNIKQSYKEYLLRLPDSEIKNDDPIVYLQRKGITQASNYRIVPKTIESSSEGQVKKYECIALSLYDAKSDSLFDALGNKYAKGAGDVVFSRLGELYFLNTREKKIGIVVRESG